MAYSRSSRDCNGTNKSQARLRSLRLQGPRFIRGRRSIKLTTVWTLKPRRLASEVLA